MKSLEKIKFMHIRLSFEKKKQQQQHDFYFAFCSDVSLTENQYALYGHKTGRIPRNANQMYDPTR